MYTFGVLLKEVRKLRCLTQEDLSERSRISVSAIRLIERNQRSPRPYTLRQFMGALQIPTICEIVFSTAANDGQISAIDFKMLILEIKGYPHHPPVLPLSQRNMVDIGQPQTVEAMELRNQFQAITRQLASNICARPFKVFIWEPANVFDMDVDKKRHEIHEDLTQRGHQAFFSRDHIDPTMQLSSLQYSFAAAQIAEMCIVITELVLVSTMMIDEMLTFCELTRQVSRLFLMIPKVYRQKLKSNSLICTLEKDYPYHKVWWYSKQELNDSLVQTLACNHTEMQRLLYAVERKKDG